MPKCTVSNLDIISLSAYRSSGVGCQDVGKISFFSCSCTLTSAIFLPAGSLPLRSFGSSHTAFCSLIIAVVLDDSVSSPNKRRAAAEVK
ncbi:unnamed protein product [Haemonchus placei]|uniref:Uncharacterized protein n=1 Tax=Haemonchus placei TaxID=6290 RepID=A0A3P7VU87_HAEPC|nr:unnamed protein product [Haemonchus placei]